MFPIQDHKEELKALCTFSALHEYFRLIDPSSHEVYGLSNSDIVNADLPPCYAFWHREAPCANCISMRACQNNTSFLKIEALDGKVFLVFAVPVKRDGKAFSLELATDVTQSMFVADRFYQNNTEITALIAEFNDIAVRDTSTKLYNNQYIRDKLDTLINASSERPLSFLLWDLDNFKKINDQYGHLLGDQVIASVAELLKKISQPENSYAGRMGGDEFALILDGVPLSEATLLADRFSAELAAISFTHGEERFGITVSFGVVQHLPGEGNLALIDRADRLMYQNKAAKKYA